MTARQHPCPCPQTVDVWSISLASAVSPSSRPTGVLSPAEITRAKRLVQPKDRQRFITARTALRGILGSYLGLPPAAVSFRINAHGKPYLDPASAMLQFNLSHSGDWALCAVTTAGEVGVDIEQVRTRSSAYRLKVARRFFSAQEYHAINSAGPAGIDSAFFSGWTRKEAYIKCHGKGLAIPLATFTVSIGTTTPATLIQSDWNPVDVTQCHLYDLEVPAGYYAALALLNTQPIRICQLNWVEPAASSPE
jgi:4'-phosphopantetheinyl transferase